MKLLIHAGNLEKWSKAIGNAKNAKKLKPECKVVIVANGTAVIALKEKISINLGLRKGFKDLEELGVEVKACNNSIITFDLDVKELIGSVTVVKAAVIEMLERQEEGYAYIKA